MADITALDIYNYLPEKIQALLFNESVDVLMNNIFSIANVSIEQQSLLYRDVVSTLIGKYDTAQLKNLLKTTYLFSDNIATTVMNLLNVKLFDGISSEMKQTKIIFQNAEKNQLPIEKNEVLNNLSEQASLSSPDKLVSFIKDLAASMAKQEKSDIKPVELKPLTTTENEKIDNPPNISTFVQPKESASIPTDVVATTIPLENSDHQKRPDSILLQAMRQHAIGEESKLNKYYKDLQDSLSEKTKETKNVFQPPFKSSVNRGALIESFFDDTQHAPNITSETNKSPLNSAPIQYKNWKPAESVDQNVSNKSTHEEKFIDLGDL